MPFPVFRIFVLGLAVFAGGWLGMKMAVPPGYSSPLWPPAGVALAGLLIGGRRLWPGVWLGALANQFLAVADFAGDMTFASMTSSLLIATGSTLQALTAVWLSAKWLGPGLPKLDGPRSILIFFGLTAPVASLIAPSIGIVVLRLLDVMPLSLVGSSWWNWWIGDSLGVLVISPLLFCLFGKPRELWGSRRLSVALPLLGTLLTLITVFGLVFRSEQSRIQQAFDSQASAVDRLLVEYADNVIDSTLVLRDLYSASGNVDRREFGAFAQRLLARHPEIQALEWLPRVSYDALPAFEKSVRDEGYPGFKVIERDSDGQPVPVGKREEYFPILFVEPMLGNEKAFGLDSTAKPLSRESKQMARDSGKAAASQRLMLMQRNDLEPGVLVSIPVYINSQVVDPKALAGFVSAVVLPARLADVAVRGLNTDIFGITLLDIDAPAGQDLLYSKPVMSPLGQNYRLKVWQRDFSFADRTWRIIIDPDNSFMVEHGSSLPWITLVGGLFFTSLLSVFLLTISGRTAHVEALVDDRTLELAKANAELEASERAARNSALMLRTLVESQPECVKLLARNGSLLQMNRAGLDMIEADSLDQVVGKQLDELVLPKYRNAFNTITRRVFEGESGRLEFELQGFKGGHRWLDTHAVPMRDAAGNIAALLAVTRDITERKQSEEHLKRAARVFSEAHEGILITDADAVIIDVNPTFSEITGYSREEIIGQNPRVLHSGKHSPEFYLDMWKSLAETNHWQGEVWNRKKDGELYAELLTISALCDEDGHASHYVGLFSDITQAKQQQQLLELMAHYDPLTRLPNRILFADRLTQAIARSKREKTLLAICFLDLDGFKPVNDQFGHDAGDQVLVEVAERIKNSVREEDSVSRHGGDEFALLLGDIHTTEQCEQAIERIHRAIAQPYLIDGQAVIIGASSGITLYPLDDADPDTLLRHADHAMYQAKLAGKNCHHLFDVNEDQQIIDRNKQLRDIEAAFLGNQMSLYYQPKVNIKTGQVVGVEALIRWLHPERGIISPLEFLPVIASTELEIRIGNWVIEQAWRQLVAWHGQGLRLEVSINISSYHLLWSGFFARIEAVLHDDPTIASKFLQLEILESTALDDLAAVNRIIKTCRDALGIRIALDDFGTGYSSLTHLRHLSVDTVKIDQSFVRDMLDDPDDYAIIESVIGLSHAFRREVVAEGVESKEQGIVLLLLGCHLLQGYSIARPMPAEAFANWVKAYRPYADWRFYADAELTPEQTMMAIRRIDTRQWLLRIRDCLYPEADVVPHWPIMAPGKCHLGRWLKQARQNRQFSDAWIERIEQLNRELHEQATVIMHLVGDGQLDAAQARFAQMQTLQQWLDDCFARYSAEGFRP
ncbi:MAG: EAL domain-containing protein [Methylococcaceae bacterium]|nr:EAL domain-containing protein [Methylococcaceae bacterium]